MDSEVVKIINKFAIKGVEVKKDSLLFEDLGLSSLDMVSIIFDLEAKFNKKCNIMDFKNVKTAGQLAEVFGL